MVLTDSGGLQKEAFFNQKPCVIIREETEWLELVEHDYAKIVGSNPAKMKLAYQGFKDNKPVYDKNLYGENVGQNIYQEICKML